LVATFLAVVFFGVVFFGAAFFAAAFFGALLAGRALVVTIFWAVFWAAFFCATFAAEARLGATVLVVAFFAGLRTAARAPDAGCFAAFFAEGRPVLAAPVLTVPAVPLVPAVLARGATVRAAATARLTRPRVRSLLSAMTTPC
jgi:hypothetical protein